MAQSVGRLTFGFGSGRDLTVCEFEPRVGLCADSMDPAWDFLSLWPSLSLSLSARPLLEHVHTVPLFLKINGRQKNFLIKKTYKFILTIFKTEEDVPISEKDCILFKNHLFIFFSKLHTQQEAQTHNPEVKSPTLHRLSQPGTPVLL